MAQGVTWLVVQLPGKVIGLEGLVLPAGVSHWRGSSNIVEAGICPYGWWGGCQCLDSLDEWELRWCLSHLNSVLAPKVGISGKMVVLTTEFLPTPPKWLEVYRRDFSRVAIGFTFFMPYFMTSLRCQALSFFGQHGSSVGGDCPPAPWLLPLTPWLWLSVSSLFSLPLLNHHVWSLRMLQLQGQTCLPYKNSKWVNGG